MRNDTPTRDLECDLLVLGSGAAGLTAAVTAAFHGLKVVVAEKDSVCGGATAWSGGWIWVPCHPLAAADGVAEDIAAARTYLRHELGAQYDAARVEALLAAGPRMVEFFQRHTALQFVSGAWIADIHGRSPGAGTGSRSVAAAPLDARELDAALRERLRATKYETSLFGMGVMAGPDLRQFLNAMRSPRAFVYAARRFARHLLDLALHGRGMVLVNGAALVARLMKSADALGVVLHADSPAVRLLREGAAVRGAVLATPAGERVVRAARGVVLATGGFAHDAARRDALYPAVLAGRTQWPLPPAAVAGDGLRLGESAGGVVDASLAAPAAWCPVSVVPYRGGRSGLYPHIIDRGKPGLIGVRADGRRFVNEADGYHDYVSALLAATPPGGEAVSWLVCDRRFQRRYPFGMAKPFPMPAWPYVRSGYLKRGRTLAELAQRCGIDAAGLVATVEAYNRDARRGADPAFGRGSTPFNRTSGDAAQQPNPNVAAIETAPYYAIELRPGCFGTFAGLKCDARSRVLDAAGEPIQGLYAAGCDQASVMGGHYPSGGINLGPAMSFAWIAARHAAGIEAPVEENPR